MLAVLTVMAVSSRPAAPANPRSDTNSALALADVCRPPVQCSGHRRYPRHRPSAALLTPAPEAQATATKVQSITIDRLG